MEGIFNLVFGNLKIQHINYIYPNAEKHAKLMESKFKMPKFEFSEDLDHPATYRGRETKFSIKMGVSRCFNTSIEIFEWIKGDSVYKEFVDTQKEGLHHFGVFVENLQEYVDYLKKQGIEVIQTGMFPPRLKYAYMDTLKIFGVVIEFIELVKRKRKN
ncbi:MAG: VOC family protein [Promethearchaeota archaeon]